MRVLWFSNTASLASKNIWNEENYGSGKWIEALEEQIKKIDSVQLGIAFHRNKQKEFQAITDKNVTYYVLPKKHTTKVGKLISNWKNEIGNAYEISLYHKVVKDYKPDIIHFWGFENTFTRIIPTLSIPYIIHIQGINNVHKHFILNSFNVFKLLMKTNIVDLVKGYSIINIYFNTLKRAKYELEALHYCNNFFGRTTWDKRFLFATKNTFNYYHCDEIMKDQFYYYKWEKKRANKITLFTTLRDNPWKGIDSLFYVSEILDKHCAQYNYEWLITSISENSQYIKAMKSRKMKLSKNVKLLGKISDEEMIKNLLNSDLFVYASKIENGCNAVQEAMLLGMPIVCTSAGGMATTITNNETGLLVQPGDPYAMAGAIIELIKDYEFAKKMGANARLVAHKRHDKEKIVDTVISTYRTIINNECK